MKKLLFGALGLMMVSATFAQDKYQVKIDLTAAANDQVPVEVIIPQSDDELVEYHMAKVVPGTYSISDFGRFVSDFKAFDKDGNELPYENVSTNKWQIENGGKLHKITYLVDDTWDLFSNYGDNIIFEPGGTNINRKENVFVINTFGFIGYIDGQKFVPYELTIEHKESTFGATALKKETISKTTDSYFADVGK